MNEYSPDEGRFDWLSARVMCAVFEQFTTTAEADECVSDGVTKSSRPVIELWPSSSSSHVSKRKGELLPCRPQKRVISEKIGDASDFVQEQERSARSGDAEILEAIILAELLKLLSAIVFAWLLEIDNLDGKLILG